MRTASVLSDDAKVDTSGLNFKAANREALFRLGYDRAVAGKAWREPKTPVGPPVAMTSTTSR